MPDCRFCFWRILSQTSVFLTQGLTRNYRKKVTLLGSLIEDVGIPTERPGRDFQTAFRIKDEFAFAVANPGDSQVVVELSVYDRLDPTSLVASQEILLEPGEMKAMFLDEILIGLEIKEGHLWIRSDGEGDFILSGLITQSGFFVSAQSISRIE